MTTKGAKVRTMAHLKDTNGVSVTKGTEGTVLSVFDSPAGRSLFVGTEHGQAFIARTYEVEWVNERAS